MSTQSGIPIVTPPTNTTERHCIGCANFQPFKKSDVHYGALEPETDGDGYCLESSGNKDFGDKTEIDFCCLKFQSDD